MNPSAILTAWRSDGSTSFNGLLIPKLRPPPTTSLWPPHLLFQNMRDGNHTETPRRPCRARRGVSSSVPTPLPVEHPKARARKAALELINGRPMADVSSRYDLPKKLPAARLLHPPFRYLYEVWSTEVHSTVVRSTRSQHILKYNILYYPSQANIARL